MLLEQPEIKARVERGQEERVEYFNGLIDQAIARLETSKVVLGTGKTADVNAVDKENPVCLKTVIKSRVRDNFVILKNGVNEEIEYLDKLADNEFLHGIGINRPIVPQPLFSRQDAKYGFLFMENIKGASLKDVLENPEHSELLKNTDWTNFFTDLEDIVGKIHQAKIFHRDLHAGNIMVNEAGQAILIDFGNAYESYLSDEDPYHEEYLGETTIYRSDDKSLQEVKTQIFSTINNITN